MMGHGRLSSARSVTVLDFRVAWSVTPAPGVLRLRAVRRLDAQVTAYLADKIVVDFRVARNRRSLVKGGIDEPGMPRSLP